MSIFPHFFSIKQVDSVKKLQSIMERADQMAAVVRSGQQHHSLAGKSIAILFYQPSTRTFSSFLAAATRLGAYTTPIHGMSQYSSVTKGETLQDTIRSIYQTTAADLIVLRHPDNNASQIAAEVSPVPVVNAGSGKLEHPTQALLDMYTIYQNLGRMNGLHVVMVGDMLYGRTVKSLAKLLALTSTKSKKNKITFVAPEQLAMPEEELAELRGKVEVEVTTKLEPQLATADVVYMTRVQKEWFEHAGKLDEYEQIKHQFIMTRHLASLMPEKSSIMHPLPRVGEIMLEVDDDPRAHYFSQMRSGLYVRMALLEMMLTD